MLHIFMQLKNAKGLSNWMVGDLPLSEAIHKTLVPNLDVLPCGPIPPNPAELLSSSKMNELLEYARRNYDNILFDSPPLDPVGDALILSAMTDRVVLVIHPSRSNRHAVRSAVKQLRGAGANLAGFVFNKIDISSKRYGKYYYSKYGYYYKEKYYTSYTSGYDSNVD